MAARWAADLGNVEKAMVGFGMFYRLLVPIPSATGILTPLPRVSEETRPHLVGEIDEKGPADDFTWMQSQISKRVIRSCSRQRTILPRE